MEKQDIETLEEARQYLRERMFKDGAKCPCCKQNVKVYKRSITSSMAWGLSELYARRGQDYTHCEDFFKSNDNVPSSVRGDFTKFLLWMIIEAHPDDRGVYRITNIGKDFLLNGLEVPKFFFVYNDDVIKQSKQTVTIREASKNKFNLNEVLGPVIKS